MQFSFALIQLNPIETLLLLSTGLKNDHKVNYEVSNLFTSPFVVSVASDPDKFQNEVQIPIKTIMVNNVSYIAKWGASPMLLEYI